jgi:hypothetical protein
MAEEHTLTTALQARQPSVSTNPIGLSANLTQQAEPAPQIDFVSKISDRLDALSGALDVFEQTKGQPNTELLALNSEMATLEAKLRELAVKRDELKAIGTPEQKLHRAVDAAERTLTRMVMNYEVAVSEEILAERYGQPVPLMKLDRRERDSLKLHKRISDLRKFSVNSSSETDVSVEALLRRANRAGERLDEMKAHIEQDQREHRAKK